MGMQGPLTAQALGRSPYDDVIQGEGPEDHRHPQQQYDQRGRPVNPDTKRINREIVRSHNEVMLVIGVAEPENPNKSPEAESQRRHDAHEEEVGRRLDSHARRAMEMVGLFGIHGIRQRILVYRDYSKVPYWQFWQQRNEFSWKRDVIPGAAAGLFTNYLDRALFRVWLGDREKIVARRIPKFGRRYLKGFQAPLFGAAEYCFPQHHHQKKLARLCLSKPPSNKSRRHLKTQDSYMNREDDYATDEDDSERVNTTLISFDVEATEASPDAPPGLWSAELRPSQAADAKADAQPVYLDTLLTQLPALLAANIYTDTTLRLLMAAYEATALRLMARYHRLRYGLPCDDIYVPNVLSELSWRAVTHLVGAELMHLAISGEIWAFFTGLAQYYHMSDKEWKEAEAKRLEDEQAGDPAAPVL
ncbi:hypothetical protein CCM_03198 [Cordyceps militaris CM01]|uniref:Uncharacterized protein n=1 Tax=Cordyceps militaris (strain CM01) TaxID=983644 RepID=G3J9E9_CORMM|nr:uncharacterized protein CCM_03198 [Cordyceps militaris CM01]EGX94926.1 hypothetical protein CCM_03198 [Cordyceps militaris CM01]